MFLLLIAFTSHSEQFELLYRLQECEVTLCTFLSNVLWYIRMYETLHSCLDTVHVHKQISFALRKLDYLYFKRQKIMQ